MISTVTILIRLIIAHLIGDFFLQPHSWVEQRNKLHFRSGKLYVHSFIHALLAWAAVWDLEKWPVPCVIFLTHLLIDALKSYQRQHKMEWFIADQLLHLLVIGALWQWMSGFEVDMKSYFSDITILTVIAAILSLTTPTAILIGIATRKWRKKLEEDKKKTLKDAGMWIGIIERLLVFIFVLNGQYEAVGFLLAAKSIFRFGDLRKAKEKNQTEYLMIGSLLSFGLAVVISLLARQIIY